MNEAIESLNYMCSSSVLHISPKHEWKKCQSAYVFRVLIDIFFNELAIILSKLSTYESGVVEPMGNDWLQFRIHAICFL